MQICNGECENAEELLNPEKTLIIKMWFLLKHKKTLAD